MTHPNMTTPLTSLAITVSHYTGKVHVVACRKFIVFKDFCFNDHNCIIIILKWQLFYAQNASSKASIPLYVVFCLCHTFPVPCYYAVI